MTADEIRAKREDPNPTWVWTREIALQLALGNERLERIATALETIHRETTQVTNSERDKHWPKRSL